MRIVYTPGAEMVVYGGCDASWQAEVVLAV